MFESYSEAKRNRLPFLAGAVGIAAAVCLGIFGYSSLMKNRPGMQDLYKPRSQVTMIQSAEMALGRMRSGGKRELAYDKSGRETVPERIDPESVTIMRRDSPLLRPYIQRAGEFRNIILNNLDYAIFSPNVIDKGDVNGIFLGNGSIMIDTMADDGRPKNEKLVPSTMVHEAAGHGATSGLGISTLNDEKFAYQAEMGVLSRLMREDSDPILKAAYMDCGKKLATARFLGQFGHDFGSVRPESVMISLGFLDAGISRKTIAKYLRATEGKGGLYRELHLALFYADIPLREKRERAISLLFDVVENPKFDRTLEQVNAASALHYLAPDALPLSTSADISVSPERTISLPFGTAVRKSGGAGRGRILKAGGFAVSGLPSREDVFVNTKPIAEGKYIDAVLYDGLVMKRSGNKVFIPEREGRPGPGFYRMYVRAEDGDHNGRPDVLLVFYGTNSLGRDDGSILSKVDVFRHHKFEKSGLVLFDGKAIGEDLSPDIDYWWKRFSIEP